MAGTEAHHPVETTNGTGVRFLGHATFELDLGGATVLTDPLLRQRVTFLRRLAPPPLPPSPTPTAVVVSHLHHDHCDLRSLALLGPSTPVVVPAGGADLLRRHGFDAVVPLAAGQSWRAGELTVTATPARHSGRREPWGPSAGAVGYLLETPGRRVYFAGDTDLFAQMEGLGAPLDLALVPVGGWGPRLGPGHLDPVRAAEAVARLRPRVVVPMHYGSFGPLGYRPSAATRRAPAQDFAREVHRRSPATHVRVLAPGSGRTWVA
ncbi:MBL fold metallo-hydrolase [Oryzihumus sp.]